MKKSVIALFSKTVQVSNASIHRFSNFRFPSIEFSSLKNRIPAFYKKVFEFLLNMVVFLSIFIRKIEVGWLKFVEENLVSDNGKDITLDRIVFFDIMKPMQLINHDGIKERFCLLICCLEMERPLVGSAVRCRKVMGVSCRLMVIVVRRLNLQDLCIYLFIP